MVSTLTGGRGWNLFRAIMAPQRVKMDNPGSALQTWENMVARHNTKKDKIGEVELAAHIECSAVESIVSQSLEAAPAAACSTLQKYEHMRVEIIRTS